jgi:hypothetical protein
MSDTASSTGTDWRTQATISVPKAGAILGLNRCAAYAAARRGELPTIMFGHRIMVLTKPLARMLEGTSL